MSIDDAVIYKPEGIDGPAYPAIVTEVHGSDCLTVRVPSLNDETIQHINFYADESNLPPKARHVTVVT